MQSIAGFVHSGTDFFITDAGLIGSETTIVEFFPLMKKVFLNLRGCVMQLNMHPQ